jgi:hypothetical protein
MSFKILNEEEDVVNDNIVINFNLVGGEFKNDMLKELDKL